MSSIISTKISNFKKMLEDYEKEYGDLDIVFWDNGHCCVINDISKVFSLSSHTHDKKKILCIGDFDNVSKIVAFPDDFE